MSDIERATDQIWSALVARSSITVRLDGENLPQTGYYVGGVTAPLVDASDRSDVREFISQSTCDYVGAWKDTDGSTYVDDVTWVERFLDALHLATERAEIAFYDIANSRDIRV